MLINEFYNKIKECKTHRTMGDTMPVIIAHKNDNGEMEFFEVQKVHMERQASSLVVVFITATDPPDVEDN